jgi:glycosyltransferase involved in cell wall biosynthesis
MRVSGFSMVRDAVRLHYPVAESIRSILPICDEFVIAVGQGEDGTVERIRAIGDPKIRVLETKWNPAHFVHGAINAVQSNLALDQCTGDWAFYVQADEVVHEDDLPLIVRTMEEHLDDPRVEGLLFRYLHFWGDFDHYHGARNWYRHEVRVVRNVPGMRSWKSAQGFRVDGRRPRVVDSNARIFHYGWVRPPEVMKRKQMTLDRLHHPEEWVKRRHPQPEAAFDYGPLDHLRRFAQTHPAVMREWMARKAWDAAGYRRPGTLHEHNRRSVRALTWVEDHFLRHRLGEYRNYVRID